MRRAPLFLDLLLYLALAGFIVLGCQTPLRKSIRNWWFKRNEA